MTQPNKQEPDGSKSTTDLSLQDANMSFSPRSEEGQVVTIDTNLVIAGIDAQHEINCIEEGMMHCWDDDVVDDDSLISTDESYILSLLDRAIAIGEDFSVDSLRSSTSQSTDLLLEPVEAEIMVAPWGHNSPPVQSIGHQGSSAQLDGDDEADTTRFGTFANNVSKQ